MSISSTVVAGITVLLLRIRMASIVEVVVSIGIVVVVVVVVVAGDALHPLNVLSRSIPISGGCRSLIGIHIGVVAPLTLLIVVVSAIVVIVIATSVIAIVVAACI